MGQLSSQSAVLTIKTEEQKTKGDTLPLILFCICIQTDNPVSPFDIRRIFLSSSESLRKNKGKWLEAAKINLK